MSEVPNGWLAAAVDDVCQIVRGITFPTTDKRFEPGTGLIACLRTANVQSTVEWDDLWFVPRHHVKNEQQLVSPDDILISTANSYELVGKVSRVTHMKLESTLGAFISLLRAHEGIDAGFLYYQMSSESVQRTIREMSSTTTNISNVSGAKLKTLELRVAPTAEQIRIVGKLEELLCDLDAGVVELNVAQAKLARYRQSLLKNLVEGTENNKSYPQVSLAELTNEIGQGWSPKCEEEPALELQRWGVIKTTAIQPQAFDGAHNKALPIGFQPRPHLELKVGDLLITRAGPRNRVGICCLVRATRQKLMLCDKAYRIRCNTSRVEAGFLELVLNAPQFVQQIDALKTGINDSGLNLTQDRFLSIKIPLPSLDRQRELMAEIDSIEVMLREQAMAINSVLAQSTAQRKNILRAAFSGQLVPQDPNDEPASALLARIRAQREADAGASASKRGRKPKGTA